MQELDVFVVHMKSIKHVENIQESTLTITDHTKAMEEDSIFITKEGTTFNKSKKIIH